MAGKCINCQGAGKIPEHLQPYGYNRPAGHGVVICKRCGGTGKDNFADDTDKPLPKTHPVIWFFGLVGAFFAGVIKPLDTHWFVNAVLGFVVIGMAAGFLLQRSYGRKVLIVLGLCIVVFFGFAIYSAETGRVGQ